MRRIIEYCNYQEISDAWPGPCMDEIPQKWRDRKDGVPAPKISEPCGKPIQVIHEFENGGKYIHQLLACGHSRMVDKQASILHEKRNVLWDNLLPFQKTGVEFLEAANCRGVLRDEMGLGKTIQALSLIRENIERFTDNGTKYCIIVSPVGSIFNWQEETMKWLGLNKPESLDQLKYLPQVVYISKQKIAPFALILIVPWTRLGEKSFVEQVKGKVGSLIVDEAHFFKNVDSARTRNLIELIADSGKESPLIFMSGTLVENRIMEMQTALNAIDPNYFYSSSVINRMCIH